MPADAGGIIGERNGGVDLADYIEQAVSSHRTLINATGRRWPDRPIQVEFNWHPKMGKVDVVVRSIDHLPSFRPNIDPEAPAG